MGKRIVNHHVSAYLQVNNLNRFPTSKDIIGTVSHQRFA